MPTFKGLDVILSSRIPCLDTSAAGILDKTESTACRIADILAGEVRDRFQVPDDDVMEGALHQSREAQIDSSSTI
jgi:hypothetical protein